MSNKIMSKMTNIMTNFLMTILDRSWKYSNKSYSQEGEDLVLSKYLEAKKEGFYIDVGAYHPFRFSNTYLFYKRGWSGINIDATPGSMVLFKKYRPRDINIEVAVSNKNTMIQYYIFDEPALNSFSSKLSNERDNSTRYKIVKTVKLKPKKLSDILDKNMPKNTDIDYMSVDVEGYEYEIITSNNWNKYKPKYILIEILETEAENVMKNKIYKFLKTKGYNIVGITGRTAIFKIRE